MFTHLSWCKTERREIKIQRIYSRFSFEKQSETVVKQPPLFQNRRLSRQPRFFHKGFIFLQYYSRYTNSYQHYHFVVLFESHNCSMRCINSLNTTQHIMMHCSYTSEILEHLTTTEHLSTKRNTARRNSCFASDFSLSKKLQLWFNFSQTSTHIEAMAYEVKVDLNEKFIQCRNTISLFGIEYIVFFHYTFSSYFLNPNLFSRFLSTYSVFLAVALFGSFIC